MPQISEDMSPGPDLAAIDFSKLDMGNDLEAPAAEDTSPAEVDPTLDGKPLEEVLEAEEAEDAEKSDEADESAEKTEVEQPRDEKTGKFTKKSDENRIPKSRFNEAVSKEREAREAAEQRAANLEKQLAERAQNGEQAQLRDDRIKAIDAQIVELEKQYTKLILDNEPEKAAEIQSQIRQANRTVARMEAQEESSGVVRAAIEGERLKLTIAQLESLHPELNPKSEYYDNSLVEIVLLMQRDKVEKNIPPSQALKESAESVMQRFSKPVEADTAEGLANAKGLEAAEERKKASVAKALDTQKRTPASTAVTGMDSDRLGDKGLPSVAHMTVEEFNALPESTRAKLRGDMLV